jgi:hypothetical protein
LEGELGDKPYFGGETLGYIYVKDHMTKEVLLSS